MRTPRPIPGLVIHYGFLWRREASGGQEEGRKDRPCAVILVVPVAESGSQVVVLPVTHTPPTDPATAVEIPLGVKANLKLDSERSWIVLDEANEFLWPGFDIRPVPGATPARIDYGVLPPRFF